MNAWQLIPKQICLNRLGAGDVCGDSRKQSRYILYETTAALMAVHSTSDVNEDAIKKNKRFGRSVNNCYIAL